MRRGYREARAAGAEGFGAAMSEEPFRGELGFREVQGGGGP